MVPKTRPPAQRHVLLQLPAAADSGGVRGPPKQRRAGRYRTRKLILYISSGEYRCGDWARVRWSFWGRLRREAARPDEG